MLCRYTMTRLSSYDVVDVAACIVQFDDRWFCLPMIRPLCSLGGSLH